MNIIISFLPGFIFYDYSNNSVTLIKRRHIQFRTVIPKSSSLYPKLSTIDHILGLGAHKIISPYPSRKCHQTNSKNLHFYTNLWRTTLFSVENYRFSGKTSISFQIMLRTDYGPSVDKLHRICPLHLGGDISASPIYRDFEITFI